MNIEPGGRTVHCVWGLYLGKYYVMSENPKAITRCSGGDRTPYELIRDSAYSIASMVGISEERAQITVSDGAPNPTSDHLINYLLSVAEESGTLVVRETASSAG
jgi:hypothetical protein